MKRTSNKEWKDFEQQVSNKRTHDKRTAHTVPTDLIVQRMSTAPTGRLKKYEPLQAREFVPFSKHFELTIKNIKQACEQHYNAPRNSCDILVSDRGPSCTKIDQIKGRKVYLVRFLESTNKSCFETPEASTTDNQDIQERCSNSVPRSLPKQLINIPKSTYAKSLSIGDLLKAGQLIKKSQSKKLSLEYFDLESAEWKLFKEISLNIQPESFASGAFRNAFKATSSDGGIWVVKKYSQKSIDTMVSTLEVSLENHTRKQCQMHSVARNIAQRLAKKAPSEFGHTFEYNRVYFGMIHQEPVTVEEYVDGEFIKYVNNDGECIESPQDDLTSIFQKAQTLCHFSLEMSAGKLMLLDLQGSAYKLYDPEIATSDLQNENDEFYFCAGNLTEIAINKFKSSHECNLYCRLMKLEQLTM